MEPVTSPELLKHVEKHQPIRPMAYVAMGVAFGTLCFDFIPSLYAWLFFAVALASFIVLVIKRSYLSLLPLFLALMLLRLLLLPPLFQASGDYLVEGRVSSVSEREGKAYSVQLCDVRLNGEALNGRLKLYVLSSNLLYGDTISCRAHLESPYEPHNARYEGVVGYAYSNADVSVEKAAEFSHLSIPVYIRYGIDDAIDEMFGGIAGIAKAIVLGDKSDISYSDYSLFRDSGLLHIMAVSGLHLSIIAGLASKLLRGRSVATVIALCSLAWLYAAVTGFSPSVVRAAVMLSVSSLSVLFHVRYDGLSSIWLSFAVILLAMPYSLYQLSFQLSFVAIFGLYTLGETIDSAMPIRLPTITQVFSSSLAASVALFPLFAYHFNEFAFINLLVSIPVLPILPLFLGATLLSVFVYCLIPALGTLMSYLPIGLLRLIRSLLQLSDIAPLALPSPSLLVIFVYLLALYLLSPMHTRGKPAPFLAGVGVLLLACILWLI